jgi:hypothetical protein
MTVSACNKKLDLIQNQDICTPPAGTFYEIANSAWDISWRRQSCASPGLHSLNPLSNVAKKKLATHKNKHPACPQKMKTAILMLFSAKTHELPEVAWGFFISLEQRLERRRLERLLLVGNGYVLVRHRNLDIL